MAKFSALNKCCNLAQAKCSRNTGLADLARSKWVILGPFWSGQARTRASF